MLLYLPRLGSCSFQDLTNNTLPRLYPTHGCRTFRPPPAALLDRPSQDESDAHRKVSEMLGQAVAEAEGRLVAARIILKGATELHGALHHDPQGWRAELIARAQDHGEAAVWVERIRIETTPTYDLAELAERDDLTKVVLETLAQAKMDVMALPAEIREMLDVLPTEVRTVVEGDLDEAHRTATLDDVRSIILDALATKGGHDDRARQPRRQRR